jgi:predicted nuclease of predicted toxin-antitoxin system
VTRLLIDENLSPAVAATLRNEGHDVVHVRERGLLGVSDAVVPEKAYDEDRVLVTANVADFRKLAGARELHAGVVCIVDGGLVRDEQVEVLRRVVAALENEPDLMNRVLTVTLDGGFMIEELPPR